MECFVYIWYVYWLVPKGRTRLGFEQFPPPFFSMSHPSQAIVLKLFHRYHSIRMNYSLFKKYLKPKYSLPKVKFLMSKYEKLGRRFLTHLSYIFNLFVISNVSTVKIPMINSELLLRVPVDKIETNKSAGQLNDSIDLSPWCPFPYGWKQN